MTKRFCDTDLWKKAWFQDLSLLEKITFKYILENCDCAGVWEANYRLASFIIGENVSIDVIKSINEKKKQFEILENGDIFIIDFIKFQYGTLSETCKPHKPIIEKLKKHSLYERVSKGYPKGMDTLEEKEKEKEKEKDKEKDKEEDFSQIDLTENDPFMSNKVHEFMDYFSKEFSKGKNAISREERTRLTNVLNDLEQQGYSIEEISETICRNLKKTKFRGIDGTFNPGINWLLKDNARNFYVTMNGQFVPSYDSSSDDTYEVDEYGN